jgi:hypothetical protein
LEIIKQHLYIFNLSGYCLLASDDFSAYMNGYNGLCCVIPF